MTPKPKPVRRRGSSRRRAPDAGEHSDAGSGLDPDELRERLLGQIAQGARLCQEIERQFKQHLCPELETIIKAHRALVLQLCSEGQDLPERAVLVSALMRPILEWARLEEKRRQREWNEQRYRDESAARQAAATAKTAPKVLTPATLERIERELNLF
jgi:hypothetical protein